MDSIKNTAASFARKTLHLLKSLWRGVKNVLRVVGRVWLGSTALSLLLQFCPQLYSTSFEAYMQKKGYDKSLFKDFPQKNCRVYDRGNILVPFAMASQITKIGITTCDSSIDHTSATANVGMTSLTLVLQPLLLYKSFQQYLGGKLNAASFFTREADVSRREIYILPQAEMSADDFARTFFGEQGRPFPFRNDPQKLAQIFQAYVTLHEMRHAVQTFSIKDPTCIQESDADVYALSILKKHTPDTALFNEMKEITVHARALNGALAPDHATALAITHRDSSYKDLLQDAKAAESLCLDLPLADQMNKSFFARDTAGSKARPYGWRESRYMTLCRAFIAAGSLKDKPREKEAAQKYIDAYRYASLKFGKLPNLDTVNVKKIRLPEY